MSDSLEKPMSEFPALQKTLNTVFTDNDQVLRSFDFVRTLEFLKLEACASLLKKTDRYKIDSSVQYTIHMHWKTYGFR